jgi:hypothetical protein
MEPSVNLGSKVRDTITGFEGTATARIEYLGGWVELRVEASNAGKDESKWIPLARLALATDAQVAPQ